jgi:hypothetical protein
MVPATNSVQGVEASSSELVTKIHPGFSTVFSTEVLKTPKAAAPGHDICVEGMAALNFDHGKIREGSAVHMIVEREQLISAFKSMGSDQEVR